MKKVRIIVLVLAVIVLGAGFFIYNASLNKNIEKQEPIATENVENRVSLRIDFGDGTFKDFSDELKENYSAFDLLKEASEKLAIPIKTKTYDIGVLVEAINGIEGGKDNKYWLYYVNGEMPMLASDKNYLKPGDKVEFKFEESQF